MISNQRGISLVQVIVAAGIMSGMFLALMKMQTNTVKSQKQIKSNMEIDRFVASLNTYLSRTDICESSLGGVNVQEDPALVKAIKKANGNNRYEWNKNYGDNSFRITRMYVDDFQKDSPDTDTGIATFVVDIEKIGKVYGNQKVSRQIEIAAAINSNGVIQECQSLSAAGAGGLSPGKKMDGLSEGDIQRAVTGKNIEATKAAKVQKLIKSNPMLKDLQNTMKSLQKANQVQDDSMDGWEQVQSNKKEEN